MYHYTQKALKFLDSVEGLRLTEKHPENQYGVWEVRGECAYLAFPLPPSGTPLIGYYEGHLCDVINFASEQKSFWTFGSGGSISLISVEVVTPGDGERIYYESLEDPVKTALKKERAELEARLAEISKKLEE